MSSGADYTILCADLLTGTIREEIPFDTFNWGRNLNAAGSFSGTISTRHPKATRENLDPSRTAIYVLRNGVCVWGGILWTAQADIGSADQLVCGASGFWSYFAGAGNGNGRFLKADKTYLAVDQLFIAQDLITWAQAQPGGNLGIIVGTETSGLLSSQTYPAISRSNIATLIQTLAAQVGGFDYSIDTDFTTGAPVTTMHLWYPMQGNRSSNIVFELGTNITSLQWSIDGTLQANSVDMVGTGADSTTPIGNATDTSVFGTYPLLENIQNASDTADIGTLDSLAASYLAAVDDPVESLPTLMSQVTSDLAPGVWSMGDWVEVIAHDGYVDFDEFFRITADQITVDAQGSEQVQLSFAAAGSFV